MRGAPMVSCGRSHPLGLCLRSGHFLEAWLGGLRARPVLRRKIYEPWAYMVDALEHEWPHLQRAIVALSAYPLQLHADFELRVEARRKAARAPPPTSSAATATAQDAARTLAAESEASPTGGPRRGVLDRLGQTVRGVATGTGAAPPTG